MRLRVVVYIFAALVLITFNVLVIIKVVDATTGPEMAGHVAMCTSHSQSTGTGSHRHYRTVTTCRGTWTDAKGREHEGVISDARSSNEGMDVKVRSGFGGVMLAQSMGHALPWLLAPLIVDAIVLGLFLYLRPKSRSPVASVRRRSRRPAQDVELSISRMI